MTITINTTQDRFSDLDILFTKHPITRDLVTKKDVEAVKFAVKNLVLTKHYESPFQPDMGSNVYNLLFENFTPDVLAYIKRDIQLTIENFEPRATVLAVEFQDYSDANEVRITITFTLKNVSNPITLDVIVERAR